jgi:hypothetical protein
MPCKRGCREGREHLWDNIVQKCWTGRAKLQICATSPGRKHNTGCSAQRAYIPNPVDWNSFRKIMAAIRKPRSVTVSAVIMMVRSWPSTGLSNWAIR